jgi:hypothetical protein
MSLLEMSEKETPTSFPLERVLEELGTEEAIAELDAGRLLRIRKGGGLAIRGFAADLAYPHERFKEVTIVTTSIWKNTFNPQVDIKPDEQFAIHSPAKDELKKPEEIFKWYDRQNKLHRDNQAPINVSPDIYSLKVLESIIKRTEFKKLDDGEA